MIENFICSECKWEGQPRNNSITEDIDELICPECFDKDGSRIILILEG